MTVAEAEDSATTTQCHPERRGERRRPGVVWTLGSLEKLQNSSLRGRWPQVALKSGRGNLNLLMDLTHEIAALPTTRVSLVARNDSERDSFNKPLGSCLKRYRLARVQRGLVSRRRRRATQGRSLRKVRDEPKKRCRRRYQHHELVRQPT